MDITDVVFQFSVTISYRYDLIIRYIVSREIFIQKK